MINPARLLRPPVLPDTALLRSEVNKAIDNAMKKDVVYIHAPAGFGKTIAMSMWLEENQIPAAWIPLTAYDDAPAVFCRYLLTALSEFDTKIAGYAREALDTPGFDSAPFEYVFKTLSSKPDAGSTGIIVLDDFHLIENEAILKALPLIIKKLLPMHKLAILSRLNPPTCFYDMVVKNSIGEVTEKDLRFTKMQIIGLYKSYGIELSLKDAAEIETKTGGWALGLGARLISARARETESLHSGASGQQYINSYLRNEIWDKWDDSIKEFLIRTSILEDLPCELCDKLCNCNSKKMLSELMNSSGLVVRLSDNSFRYHHILRDFLRQLTEELCINLSRYYIIAADYMYRSWNLPAALDYYKKSEDNEALNSFLHRIVDYDSINSGIEDIYNSFNNHILKNIPVDMAENSLALSAPCTWVSFASGNMEQFEFWVSRLDRCIENDTNASPRLLCGTLLFQFCRPSISTRDIQINPKYGKFEFDSIPTLTITSNLPYLHRSHRDYSDIANDWEDVIPVLVNRFKDITGNTIVIFMDGVAGGLLYEQNKLARAKEYALKAYSLLTDKIHPEIWYAVQISIAMILFAERDEKGAWAVIHEAEETIEKNSALYLMKNLNAIKVKYCLYKGDKEAAEKWLSSYMVSNTYQVTIFQIYQVLTTIRAKISTGSFASALILLSNAEKVASDYHRPLDQIEIYILQAIIYWKEKKRANAVDCMKKAVSLAMPYGYVRMFANEGAAIVPILQKLYNKTMSGPEEPDLSCFIRELILCASENASYNPGITSCLEEKPVKLSKQQRLMLDFLDAGKNNRQICMETGLKHTVLRYWRKNNANL